MSTDQVLRLAVGVVLLLGVALAVQGAAGLRLRAAAATALVRGAVQLAFVGLVLGGVLAGSPAWTVLVIAVMYTTATTTSSRRLRGLPGAGRAVLLACAAGAAAARRSRVGWRSGPRRDERRWTWRAPPPARRCCRGWTRPAPPGW